MSIEDDYKALFNLIQRIVDGRPDQVPQLLAVILAGGPFRPALEKPEIMSKVVVLAKQIVADRRSETAKDGKGKSGGGEAAKRISGKRTVQAQDVGGTSRPPKA